MKQTSQALETAHTNLGNNKQSLQQLTGSFKSSQEDLILLICQKDSIHYRQRFLLFGLVITLYFLTNRKTAKGTMYLEEDLIRNEDCKEKHFKTSFSLFQFSISYILNAYKNV